jgi:pyridoxal 5'-phosphate synthase pdxT subunit
MGTVGVLALQGCVAPHQSMLQQIGAHSVTVRTVRDLGSVDRLILPGGESSTMLSLIRSNGLFAPLVEFGRAHPMWGICAGAILLASDVVHPAQESLGVLNIRAHRNYYGTQHDSFSTTLRVDPAKREMQVQFIRAPHLESLGPEVKCLASLPDGRGVLFEQGRTWASAFHTELGHDPSLHEAFLRL